ncbi:MAG: hypothetical protein KJ757_03870 [Planctomycetes bacterium]|nr:hypothetical protein [Planctomycetota bacterium]MBU2457406.1 hypothetical protein [Planctomycetota bacterium]MBU2596682.1 hypothetical protein [Planctomycetota bacterium]
MFIVKRFFIAFILSAAVISNCFADYIHDIPVETIEGTLTSPLYEPHYEYDISFSNLQMNIELRLYRRGLDPALAQFWEAGIENTWNHKFDIADRDFHYHINFDVVFCSVLSSSVHHSIDWAYNTTDRDAAHKVGHLIGLYDEYTGGMLDLSNPIFDSTSIMSDLGTAVYDRHYQAFLDWVEPYADGRRLFLTEYGADWSNPEIPEPASAFLVICGAGLLGLQNRKR